MTAHVGHQAKRSPRGPRSSRARSLDRRPPTRGRRRRPERARATRLRAARARARTFSTTPTPSLPRNAGGGRLFQYTLLTMLISAGRIVDASHLTSTCVGLQRVRAPRVCVASWPRGCFAARATGAACALLYYALLEQRVRVNVDRLQLENLQNAAEQLNAAQCARAHLCRIAVLVVAQTAAGERRHCTRCCDERACE